MADLLGPYELRGELGRGAMAVVWRAWDPSLERELAIKEPMIPFGVDSQAADEFIERFVREGKAAAGLNHPGIITIHNAGVFDGRPAIVMELVEGQTLAAVLDRGPLSPAASVSILGQLLDAVAYAHDRGVVHRDIKPDNVFVTPEGRVKLADFGIAHMGGSVTLTREGTVMGTPGYMAPEQVTGDPVDGRTDVFAIGAIAYEMVAGRNPFGATDGAAPTTVMYRIVHEEPPELPEGALAGFPVPLAAIIGTALAKSPDDRFNDARAFSAAVHGTPGHVKPDKTSATWLPYLIVGAIGVLVLVVLWLPTTSPSGGAADLTSGSAAGGQTTTSAAPALVTPTAPTSPAAPAPATPAAPAPAAPAAPVIPTQGSPRELLPTKASATSTIRERPATVKEEDFGMGSTIKHPASSLIDRIDGAPNPTTAWQARGSGIGESVTISFANSIVVDRVQIVPGYHKLIPTDGYYRFPTTASVRALTVSIDDGTKQDFELEDLRDRSPKTSHVRTLQLAPEMQRSTKNVKFTINAIYAPIESPPHSWGERSGDTAISMLRFWGWEQ